MEQRTQRREEISADERSGGQVEGRAEDSVHGTHSAWHAFCFLTGTRNPESYRASYLGSWASRAAFGTSLLEEFGAAERLSALPTWLQPYVRVDPEAIVSDFVGAGYYHVAELPDVVHVFDRQALEGI